MGLLALLTLGAVYGLYFAKLGWDVLVLTGYVILNAVCGFYYLYMQYTARPVNMKFFMPLVYISIAWALSIHTVTAFLMSTMHARPLWYHSMMPIRFITTAFGEVVEYYPTLIEVPTTIGIWGMGFFILTILLKRAIGILLGEVKAS